MQDELKENPDLQKWKMCCLPTLGKLMIVYH